MAWECNTEKHMRTVYFLSIVAYKSLTYVQEIEPRIYMADSDFDAITNNRSICNAQGNVGPKEFCEIMTKEIRLGRSCLFIGTNRFSVL